MLTKEGGFRIRRDQQSVTSPNILQLGKWDINSLKITTVHDGCKPIRGLFNQNEVQWVFFRSCRAPYWKYGPDIDGLELLHCQFVPSSGKSEFFRRNLQVFQACRGARSLADEVIDVIGLTVGGGNLNYRRKTSRAASGVRLGPLERCIGTACQDHSPRSVHNQAQNHEHCGSSC